MKAMIYKGYAARIEFDAGDEIFTGRIAGIRDVIGFHAETVADLKAAFHEAVEDYIETCAKVGKSPQKPYSGNLMLRIGADVHSKAAIAAEISGKSLNQWGEEVLMKAAEITLEAKAAG
ncbi:MAG TPA: type II toxin-antitoxin system HicB family antitoxin [Asticcacaulis sp.]|nr:type II toxin-antitoxin system HicB family antitoxin [Asticcacaulis sp.]